MCRLATKSTTKKRTDTR